MKPNLEYCEIDLNKPIDVSRLPLDMYDAAKYDFNPKDLTRKYFAYQPSGGINNQRKQLESAMMIARLTGRTCIVPPFAPHSNYFYNYNKIPPKALGM